MPVATPARACKPTAGGRPKADAKKAMGKKKPVPKTKMQRGQTKAGLAPKSKARRSKKTYPSAKCKISKKPAKSPSLKQKKREKDEVERKLHSVAKLNPCPGEKRFMLPSNHFVPKTASQVYSAVHHHAKKVLKLSAAASKQKALDARVESPNCKKNLPANIKPVCFWSSLVLSQSVAPKTFRWAKNSEHSDRPAVIKLLRESQ